MYEDLAGKKILILGASSGIGNQVARAFHELSAEIIVTSRSREKLETNFKSLGLKSSQFQVCDNTCSESLNDLAKNIEPVDVLCVISGQSKLVPKHLLKRSLIDNQLAVNLVGPVELISLMLKYRKFREHASIILTSAASRTGGSSTSLLYSIAKAGLTTVHKTLVEELAYSKIRINSVSFDYVKTDMTDFILQNYERKGIPADSDTVGISPVEATVTPFLFLASSASKWMSGQLVAADAGRQLTRATYE